MSGAAAATQAQKNATRGQALQLEVAALPKANVERIIEPVTGSCPIDHPAWPGYALAQTDRRFMEPHSIRYASDCQFLDSFYTHRDSISQAIRNRVREILVSHNMAIDLPRVLLDHSPPGQQQQCIDLIFTSSDAAIEVGKDMPTIKVDEEEPFEFMMWNNSLPGTTVPIDCVRLPLQEANSAVMMKSLDCEVSEIGTVIGLGSFKITTPIEGLGDGDELRTRFYLKLARASMKVPFSELYQSLPTHFVWYGTPYRLYYPGSVLRSDVQYSADYPLEEDEATTSSDNSHSGSKTASPGSNSSTAIEVKEEEEGGSRKRSRKE